MCLAKLLGTQTKELSAMATWADSSTRALRILLLCSHRLVQSLIKSVRCGCYIKQSHIHEGEAISSALKAAFGGKPPCATWIGVASLARDEFLIEVEPSVIFLAHG
jgi:hypothetical protein